MLQGLAEQSYLGTLSKQERVQLSILLTGIRTTSPLISITLLTDWFANKSHSEQTVLDLSIHATKHTGQWAQVMCGRRHFQPASAVDCCCGLIVEA